MGRRRTYAAAVVQRVTGVNMNKSSWLDRCIIEFGIGINGVRPPCVTTVTKRYVPVLYRFQDVRSLFLPAIDHICRPLLILWSIGQDHAHAYRKHIHVRSH